MYPTATVMFMTNSMLLWWTSDSVPLPLIKKPTVVNETLQRSGERKCKVTSIKPNWQANWTYNAITALSLEQQLTWRKLLTWTDCLSHFRCPQLQTRSGIKVKSGRTINYPLYDAVHGKSRPQEQPIHPPKVPPKPKFTLEFTHYASLCMDLECKLFFMD